MAFRLRNTIQNYVWGSVTGIEEVFGVPNPSGDPVAEVWMGAHPKAPSTLETPGGLVGLDDHISADPERVLGSDVRARFGDRLPFLFKMLAAAHPLSIQAHPSLDQARAGFARENGASVPRDAATRNYRDDNHKPELIYAMTPFWGLRGFRSSSDIRSDLQGFCEGSSLELPNSENALPAFFRSLMTLPETELAVIIERAVDRAESIWPDLDTPPGPESDDARFYWLRVLNEEYPADPGVLAPLFLNVFCLRPGTATYQPAGVLHAYLRGVGLELMANSDNVLRGGLTVKHVDLDELLAVGEFRTEPAQVLSGSHDNGVTRFHAPFPDFDFARLEAGVVDLPPGSPRIVLCAAGTATIDRDEPIRLGLGESAFIQADENLRIEVSGSAFLASVGRGSA